MVSGWAKRGVDPLSRGANPLGHVTWQREIGDNPLSRSDDPLGRQWVMIPSKG